MQPRRQLVVGALRPVLGGVLLVGEPAVLLKRVGELTGEPLAAWGTPAPLSE